MMSSTEGSAAGVLEGRSGAPGGGGDRPRIVVIPFPEIKGRFPRNKRVKEEKKERRGSLADPWLMRENTRQISPNFNGMRKSSE
jgi:hypothetical protein